jgi:hypothetical protein
MKKLTLMLRISALPHSLMKLLGSRVSSIGFITAHTIHKQRSMHIGEIILGESHNQAC